MEISLKRNEALSVLATSTGIQIDELEEAIILRLRDSFWIIGGYEDCGLSLQEVANNNGQDVSGLIALILPTQRKNTEIPELMHSIFIWGESSENECENCGCEVEEDIQRDGKHTWSAFECSNPNCNNQWSNEPDWDTMKGGKDYDCD